MCVIGLYYLVVNAHMHTPGNGNSVFQFMTDEYEIRCLQGSAGCPPPVMKKNHGTPVGLACALWHTNVVMAKQL